MIDLHSHVLPLVDDGCKNFSEALELIKNLKDIGFDIIVATPHIKDTGPGYMQNLKIIKQRFKVLKQKIAETFNNQIKLSLAGEHYLDDLFWFHFSKEEVIKYEEKNSILVELPFYQISFQTIQCLFKMSIEGCRPILAHPERYDLFCESKGKIAQFSNSEVSFLVSLTSLGGKFGEKIMATAQRLIMSKDIFSIASDIHHLDDLVFINRGIDWLRQHLSLEKIEELITKNPSTLLKQKRGEDVT